MTEPMPIPAAAPFEGTVVATAKKMSKKGSPYWLIKIKGTIAGACVDDTEDAVLWVWDPKLMPRAGALGKGDSCAGTCEKDGYHSVLTFEKPPSAHAPAPLAPAQSSTMRQDAQNKDGVIVADATLLDRFALYAFKEFVTKAGILSEAQVAKISYDYADAMLAERERRMGGSA